MDEEWLENLRTGKLTLTKRRVLTFVMSQYDPLGLGSPVMLTAKILLRRLYSAGLDCGWDEPLPTSEQLNWQSFIDAAAESTRGEPTHAPSSSMAKATQSLLASSVETRPRSALSSVRAASRLCATDAPSSTRTETSSSHASASMVLNLT